MRDWEREERRARRSFTIICGALLVLVIVLAVVYGQPSPAQ